ncbi:MAG: hypothetical protein JNK15_20480 [Planctomycetes bacterium]|nr:hypothetical protein [Planctomycetota bacterium]
MMPFVRSLVASWFGRSSWRSERPSRFAAVPGWMALVGVAVAFGGGYLAGGRFGGNPQSEAGLHMKQQPAAKPGFVGEVDSKPLAKDAFIVAAYDGIQPADAKVRAVALAEFLQREGLTTARPYEFPLEKGGLWMVAVYYRNDQEMQGLKNRLLKLEDVPDANFVFRRKQEKEWPVSAAIR